jgi:hypothetical protein
MMKLTNRRSLAVAGAAALVVVLLAAGVTMVSRAFASPPSPPSASLATDGRTTATLQVLSGTSVLKIGMANLGSSGTLVRVTTPAGGPAPRLRVAGPGGARGNGLIYLTTKGASAVTITLNSAVRWQLDLGGGTQQTVANLRGGEVTGVAFTAGSDVIDLTLPRPQGSVPVRLAAGASQFLLSLPSGVPVRLTAAGGAGEITLDGTDHVGVAGGSVFTTPGWAPGAAGFDIDATAGAARVAVTTWAG